MVLPTKKAALEATAFFEGGGHEAGPQLFWLLIDVVGKEQVLQDGTALLLS